MVEAGALRWRFVFRGGALEVAEGEPLMSGWEAALRAPAFAWVEHWRDLPRPGFHDLFAMRKRGLMRIEGDWRPVMRHLQFLKDVLALPRGRA
jgi:hypothetical protein